MSTFHYSNLRVKFEGEEGSGPGVNRGFFAAMANALKTDEKVKFKTQAGEFFNQSCLTVEHFRAKNERTYHNIIFFR